MADKTEVWTAQTVRPGAHLDWLAVHCLTVNILAMYPVRRTFPSRADKRAALQGVALRRHFLDQTPIPESLVEAIRRVSPQREDSDVRKVLAACLACLLEDNPEKKEHHYRVCALYINGRDILSLHGKKDQKTRRNELAGRVATYERAMAVSSRAPTLARDGFFLDWDTEDKGLVALQSQMLEEDRRVQECVDKYLVSPYQRRMIKVRTLTKPKEKT